MAIILFNKVYAKYEKKLSYVSFGIYNFLNFNSFDESILFSIFKNLHISKGFLKKVERSMF